MLFFVASCCLCLLVCTAGMKVGCFLSRLVRVIGVFGFVGGLTNWIAVEMLFFKIPGCVGR